MVISHYHQSTQTDFSAANCEHQSTQKERSVNHVGIVTDGEVEMPQFGVEQIKDDNQAVKFCTGFVTFAHATNLLWCKEK